MEILDLSIDKLISHKCADPSSNSYILQSPANSFCPKLMMSITYFGIALLALIAILSLCYFHGRATPVLQQRTFADATHCTEILACNKFDGQQNLVRRLASRARPNQRLVRAFGIDNAFTTEDERYAKTFKNAATEKIALARGDWVRVASLAQELVPQGMMMAERSHGRIYLDEVVQSVALKVPLHILFGFNPDMLDQNAVRDMACSINELWYLSKGPNDAVNNQFKIEHQRSKLEMAIAEIFPNSLPASSPRDNPLNFILPAYETLWRVVLFCFIEVSFRTSRSAAAEEWRKQLKDSLNVFTGKGLNEPTLLFPVSVQDIVSEALRLYVPTRRIHRKYQFQPSAKPEILAADIEKLHRDPEIWDEEPLIFDPSRWRLLGKEAHKTFMPFGNKPFLCPAQKEFGPRIIGILAAALTIHIDPHDWSLEYQRGCGEDPKPFEDDEMLDTDRKAYESWEMQRKS